jgi:hypothetical protein
LETLLKFSPRLRAEDPVAVVNPSLFEVIRKSGSYAPANRVPIAARNASSDSGTKLVAVGS